MFVRRFAPIAILIASGTAFAAPIRALLERGTFPLWARTTPASVTIPSHTPMLTGVSPAKHRIEWNTDLPLTRPIWPARPTLFELAKDAGLTTAMIAGKSKFSVLAKPGSLDWVFVPKEPVTTDAIEAADLCLGRIFEAVRARGVFDSTFVLVTTDHGGAG